MKKKLFLIILSCLLLLPLYGTDKETFLPSAINVNASSEQDTTSSSAKVWVGKGSGAVSASIQVTFTRTAGSTATLDFEFQFSLDGTSWDTSDSFKLQVPTNEGAVSNVVRKTYNIGLEKVPYIRLSKIKNNDSTNNVTDCQVTISF